MNLEQFLSAAARLEHDAELVYHRAAALAHLQGKSDAANFFGEMAYYCRLHLNDALARAGIADPTAIPLAEGALGQGPESIDISRIDGVNDLDEAMSMALDAENRGFKFYENEARTSSDPDVRSTAETFAEEERGHVLALERFLGLKPY